MDHGDPVGLEHFADLAEIGAVERLADVLEHADRSDPVEGAGNVAIVDQLELDLVGDPGRGRALAGEVELLLRQGDAEHFDIGHAVEVERETAPAAADVEHFHPRLQISLAATWVFLSSCACSIELAGSVK